MIPVEHDILTRIRIIHGYLDSLEKRVHDKRSFTGKYALLNTTVKSMMKLRGLVLSDFLSTYFKENKTQKVDGQKTDDFIKKINSIVN